VQKADPMLEKYRCTFRADAGEKCEDCKSEILEGAAVFYFPDGSMSPDGTYRCYSCSVRLLTQS
jgi:DNA-directed RNA polymerase subunit RPC12/RpoP